MCWEMRSCVLCIKGGGDRLGGGFTMLFEQSGLRYNPCSSSGTFYGWFHAGSGVMYCGVCVSLWISLIIEGSKPWEGSVWNGGGGAYWSSAKSVR